MIYSGLIFCERATNLINALSIIKSRSAKAIKLSQSAEGIIDLLLHFENHAVFLVSGLLNENKIVYFLYKTIGHILQRY